MLKFKETFQSQVLLHLRGQFILEVQNPTKLGLLVDVVVYIIKEIHKSVLIHQSSLFETNILPLFCAVHFHLHEKNIKIIF
jgi:hypothetical protein